MDFSGTTKDSLIQEAGKRFLDCEEQISQGGVSTVPELECRGFSDNVTSEMIAREIESMRQHVKTIREAFEEYEDLLDTQNRDLKDEYAQEMYNWNHGIEREDEEGEDDLA